MSTFGIVHYEDEQGPIGSGIVCQSKAEYDLEIKESQKWVEADPRAYRGMWGEVLDAGFESAYQSINRRARFEGFADVDQISAGSHLDDFGRVSR